MQRGKIKWFNSTKGYGFIASGEGGHLFVHVAAVQRAGLNSLDPGDIVDFDAEPQRDNRLRAVNLRLVERAARSSRSGGW
jgi:CspA family cold shock protein